jgi:hypothetical protein
MCHRNGSIAEQSFSYERLSRPGAGAISARDGQSAPQVEGPKERAELVNISHG